MKRRWFLARLAMGGLALPAASAAVGGCGASSSPPEASSPLDDVDWWMNIVGPLILTTKMFGLVLVIMWVRFSSPRFREDQLQTFAWKFLIPLSLANIAVTAVLKQVF